MEIFEAYKEFIKPELLILIPVLYIVGMCIKRVEIKDKFIPLILGVASILLSSLYIFATSSISGGKDIALALFTSLTQGILSAGASVYFNQLYKQLQKKN